MRISTDSSDVSLARNRKPATASCQRVLVAVVMGILLLPASVMGQKQSLRVEGTVSDAATGETLPSASLQIEGTLKGTVTNTEGAFVLVLDSLPATLVVRYLGYRSARLAIDGHIDECASDPRTTPVSPERPVGMDEPGSGDSLRSSPPTPSAASSSASPSSAASSSASPQTSVAPSSQPSCVLSIRLDPASLDLPEVVVTGENPALSIMEKVIARKQLWRPGLRNFKAIAYSRLVLESDTSIAMIAESVNEVYWDRAFGFKEILKSSSGTSNIGESIIPLGVNSLPNFYDDTIELFNFDVVGVTHPDALSFYRFTLLDYERLDDDLIFKIGVTPRRELQPTFEGTVYVRESDYSLLEVQLRPNRVVTFPPPVQTLDFTYTQQYSSYGTPYLLPIDSRIEGSVEIGLPGLRFPVIRLSQFARVSEYEINTILPRSIVEQEESVRIDSASVLTMRLSDQAVQNVPLSSREREAYERIDSTLSLEEVFKPTGFLARQFMRDQNGEEDGGGADSESDSTTSFFDVVESIADALTPEFRLNRVDGFHAGLTARFKPWKEAVASVRLGWNSEDSTPEGGIGLRISLLDRESLDMDLLLDASATTRPTVGNESERLFTAPSISMRSGASSPGFAIPFYDLNYLYTGSDLPDYFRSEGASAHLIIRPHPRVRASLGYSSRLESSLQTGTDIPLIRSRGDYRANPSIAEGWNRMAEVAFTLRLPVSHPIEEGAPVGIGGVNRVGVRGEISDPMLGSDYAYTRLTASADAFTPTFYRRRFYSMTLNVHLEGGLSFGTIPSHHLHSVEPTLLRSTLFGRLKTLGGAPYQGDRYWLAYAEHDLQSIPFELIGLWSLAERGIGIIAFAGAAQTTVSDPARILSADPLRSSPRTSLGVHSEAGFSINRIFGVVRVDVAWRLDQPATLVGLSIARYF